MNVLPGWHFCHFLHQSFVTWMTGMTLLVGITGKPFRSSTTDVTSWPPPSLKWATVCLNILDSAKAEYCTSFHFSSVRPCTGGTSKFFQCIKALKLSCYIRKDNILIICSMGKKNVILPESRPIKARLKLKFVWSAGILFIFIQSFYFVWNIWYKLVVKSQVRVSLPTFWGIK